VLEDYRKNMRQLVDQAATVAKEARLAQQEAWIRRSGPRRARPSWSAAQKTTPLRRALTNKTHWVI
jgi:hypothetical protein